MSKEIKKVKAGSTPTLEGIIIGNTKEAVMEVSSTKTTVAKATNEPDLQYTPDPLLLRILQTRRSHESEGDRNFRMWLFSHIKSLGLDPKIKVAGNIYVETDEKASVLFSCHVDTVHSKAESNATSQQALSFDPVFGHIFLTDKDNSGCLGADDGVGVYIMLKMLSAKVPGKYMFHVGEECGGVGARAYVKSQDGATAMEDLNMVVAFDRKTADGMNPEVIHTQGGYTCASMEFSKALCDELNKTEFDLPFVPSGKGSFTDSKIYAPTVPECVNVSCFYDRQHTPNEYVNVYELDKLVQAVITVDWEKLPIKRKPVAEVYSAGRDYGYESMYSSGSAATGVFGGKAGPSKSWAAGSGNMQKQQAQKPVQKSLLPEPSLLSELDSLRTREDWEEFVIESPEVSATCMMLLYAKLRAAEAELEVLKDYVGG